MPWCPPPVWMDVHEPPHADPTCAIMQLVPRQRIHERIWC